MTIEVGVMAALVTNGPTHYRSLGWSQKVKTRPVGGYRTGHAGPNACGVEESELKASCCCAAGEDTVRGAINVATVITRCRFDHRQR
jgi:hypothetical protein